jgi:hypothetical protein
MTVIGVLLMGVAVLLSWSVYPRGGREARIMKVPGTWIVVPLLIMLCFLGGGALVHTYIGK